MSNAPATTAATWFDGRLARPRPAIAWLDPHGGLCVEVVPDATSAAQRLRHPIAQVHASERWADAPRPLALPDGSTLWLNEVAPVIERALPEPWHTRWAGWARATWQRMAVVSLLLVGFVVWLDRQGIGLAAQAGLFAVPTKVDKHLGSVVMKTVDGLYPHVSSIDDERQGRLRERFEAAVERQAPGTPVRLIFRAAKEGGGFNAFAAPDGTICLLDELTASLSDDEVMAVLGHELGHVVHRHGLRRVMESVGLLALAGAVFGDASTVASTLVSTAQTLRYSRAAETQADAYMREFVAEEGLPPHVILGAWSKLKTRAQAQGADGFPAWLSTHPELDERIQIEQVRIERARDQRKEPQP
jgi:Zn-dependent protease with chaperone function